MQERDEYALVPFFRFYDTVHSFLDSSIRRVIERCQRAAEAGDGLKARDVDVLKLLYLLRYIDDIKSCLDNLVILMAEDIRVDKIALRAEIAASLDRLLSQNYIGRAGDAYNFLTDEEQDIQREIRETHVDTAAIVERIGHMIFEDIYPARKYRYGKYDFAFDRMVDGVAVGVLTGGMCLRFLTVDTDAPMKSDLHLMARTKGREAAVALAETNYYEALVSAMKIRKYVKQRNVAQLPASVQDIIRAQQEEAGKYEAAAREALCPRHRRGRILRRRRKAGYPRRRRQVAHRPDAGIPRFPRVQRIGARHMERRERRGRTRRAARRGGRRAGRRSAPQSGGSRPHVRVSGDAGYEAPAHLHGRRTQALFRHPLRLAGDRHRRRCSQTHLRAARHRKIRRRHRPPRRPAPA